jgi:hypothetical protein
MPLLSYFRMPFEHHKSTEDYVYFTIPFTFVSYPLVGFTNGYYSICSLL